MLNVKRQRVGMKEKERERERERERGENKRVGERDTVNMKMFIEKETYFCIKYQQMHILHNCLSQNFSGFTHMHICIHTNNIYKQHKSL